MDRADNCAHHAIDNFWMGWKHRFELLALEPEHPRGSDGDKRSVVSGSVEEAELTHEVAGAKRKKSHLLDRPRILDDAEGAADDDIQVIVGGSFRDQHIARLEIAKCQVIRQRTRLLLRKLGRQLRDTQCVDNGLVGHDFVPEVGKGFPPVPGCCRPNTLSARFAKASTRLPAMPSNTRPAPLPTSGPRNSERR